MVTAIEAGWPGYAGQAFASDQTATSSADLHARVAALSPGAAGSWHRIKVAATGDWSPVSRDEILIRGSNSTTDGGSNAGGGTRDFSVGSGGVLIEPEGASPAISSKLRVLGFRGVHIRNLDLVRDASLNTAGTDVTTWVPGAGVSPRDEPVITVDRTDTYPEFAIARIENNRIGAEWAGITDEARYMSGIVVKAAEQVDSIGNRFKGYQTAHSIAACRRYRRHRVDHQRGIGDCQIVTMPSTFETAYAALWPDKACYVWDRLNTTRNIVDNCGKTNASGGDLRLYDEHMDHGQIGTSGDMGGGTVIYNVLSELDVAYMERVTFVDGSVSGVPTRLAGGNQFQYADDTPAGIKMLAFSLGGAVTTPTIAVQYSGWSRFVNVTGAMTGSLPPSATVGNAGFNTSYDSEATFYSRQHVSYTLGSDHKQRKCVIGGNSSMGAGGVPADALAIDGAVAVTWKSTSASGTKPAAKMAGTFGTDAEGRTTYSFLDDGSDTPAQFRARWYAQMRLLSGDAGLIDPALWPAT